MGAIAMTHFGAARVVDHIVDGRRVVDDLVASFHRSVPHGTCRRTRWSDCYRIHEGLWVSRRRPVQHVPRGTLCLVVHVPPLPRRRLNRNLRWAILTK